MCPQRIGDVLLATPLARSLKRAWPEAELDVLVFQGCEGALENNPDIAAVLALPQRTSLRDKLSQLRRLWRRYDLAVSPLPTDRARLYCRIAARHAVGLLRPGRQERSKALLLDQWALFDDRDTHTVAMGLSLATLLGIAPCAEVVLPRAAPAQRRLVDDYLAALATPSAGLVVLHPYPKFAYKMWPRAAWIALGRWLQARGLNLVFTGAALPEEMAYVHSIAAALGGAALNLAGRLSLAQSADLIGRARLYVGPDTAVTHIAAATGTPTIALFGPSNPVKWGPWPSTWRSLASPWQRRGSACHDTLCLLQGEDIRGCVPCGLEGCDRHLASRSACLDTLSVQRVTQAAERLLDQAISAPAARGASRP